MEPSRRSVQYKVPNLLNWVQVTSHALHWTEPYSGLFRPEWQVYRGWEVPDQSRLLYPPSPLCLIGPDVGKWLPEFCFPWRSCKQMANSSCSSSRISWRPFTCAQDASGLHPITPRDKGDWLCPLVAQRASPPCILSHGFLFFLSTTM